MNLRQLLMRGLTHRAVRLDDRWCDLLETRRWVPGWAWGPDVAGVLRPVCRLLRGHLPERDHCGMPAHDACVWCGERMPGAAGR